MAKRTRLNESAEIYQQRKEQSEKEKLSEMNFKKKLEYLWEYYRVHAFATIAVGILVFYIIKTIVTPDIKTQLYVAIINNSIETTALEELQIEVEELLQINPDSEDIVINSSFYFNGTPDYEMNMRQALVAYISAQDVDIIIAPESEMYSYSYNGFLYPLSEFLPTDIYSSLTDYFYLTDQEDDPKETVYGIYLNDTDLFKNNARLDPEDPYILGVIGNNVNQNNSVEFIRHLFKD